MKQKQSYNFMIGLLFGGLAGLLLWYWQKSTSAEDGALALLDKLAATEKRVRELKAELLEHGAVPEALRNISLPGRMGDIPSFLSKESEETASQDDLTRVKGVGEVFNGRLQRAGITNIAKLRTLSPEQLAEILQIRVGRAENILEEAKNA